MQEIQARKSQHASLTTQQRTEEPLSPDAILTAEFEYIAQAAFQANEDRARVSTFYLVTVGTLVAATLSTQSEGPQEAYAYPAFAIVFGVMTVTAILTVLQLARLREAWRDSVSAMNRIKEFYIDHIHQVQLEEAFLWTMSTLPAKFKPWSISWWLAVQAALLGGVTAGGAILFAGLCFDSWWWGSAIGGAVAAAALQIMVYWWLLRR